MALFYNGEDTPSPQVIEADIFQILRTGPTNVPDLVNAIRQHFNGKVSDIQIKQALRSLHDRG